MELLFESRREILEVAGKLHFIQTRAKLHPEPVLEPSTFSDGAGCSIYGSVLRDGGRLRMWYQAWPEDWDGGDSNLVAYAESDDGISWTKPKLGLVEHGPGPSNLCNLGFHSPSVFVDPDAPASHRYRATGYAGPDRLGAPQQAQNRGYYTAHSSDGLSWELDSVEPTWAGGDVITSAYHPTHGRALVALKRPARVAAVRRRAVWTAELRDGEWGEAHCALVPDDFDDLCAAVRGYASADYYGMGLMPAGAATVGFLWPFRHSLPRTPGTEAGVFGAVDVSLVYQAAPGECWLHAPGRADFLTHGTVPWAAGGLYTSSCPVTIGDEQRLYLCGTTHSHGWYVNNEWKVVQDRKNQLIEEGIARIGFASFPRDRLFGFHADPDGILSLDIGEVARPSELFLNYETEPNGSIRVELDGVAERGIENAVPLTGSSLAQPAAWKDGTCISASPAGRVKARIHMDRAVLYAYDVRPRG